PKLANADTVAALAVAAIVVWVSLKLGKKSVDDLLDRIPDDLRDKVTQAAEAVRTVVPGADVVVHAEPLALSDHDITTQIRVLAARHGLGAHAIRLYEEDLQRRLELHLEVPESLTLQEAHRQATSFEDEVRSSVPGLLRIVSHLEPVGDNTAFAQAEPADAAEVLAAIDAFFQGGGTVAQ